MSGSSFSLTPEDWRPSLDLHLRDYPFCMRPFQSYATLALASVSGMAHKDAFFVIQYCLAGLTAYLFYRFLLVLGFGRRWGHVGLAFYLLSFPVLAAHFAPIHTWDDFWLYGFLIATSLALLKHNWPMVALFFFAACLARETATFFFPVLVFMAWQDRHKIRQLLLIICLAAPVAAFLVYMSRFDSAFGPAPWGLLKFNFANSRDAADSIVSLINAFSWLLPAAILGWFLMARRDRSRQEKFLFCGLILYWPVNTAATMALAMVRETRLLFPPFIFVIPLALYAVREAWLSGMNRASWRRLALYIFITLALGAAGIWLAYALHPVFAYGSSSVMRRDMAGLSVGLSAAFLLLWLVTRRKS